MLTVSGKLLSSYPLEELRDLMAYVPQDAYLFDGTIEENIRYGKPDASTEEVTAAAKSAHAHKFIIEQPEGYQTLVGERGAKLSGGQRQRIAIARALLKDAPILLLDEATSALDSESEALVQQALETLMQGRTTIAIAHRLSTIQHADAIYVMEAGKVVEQGTHEVLLARGGVYNKLYALQGAV
jgi:ABC-type multidrug transport system fused ATPase/permease subunit